MPHEFHVHHLVEAFLSGGVATAIFAHAVNTFPVPKNQYGQWFLSLLQFSVGQLTRATNTWNGKDSIVTGVPKN